LTTPDRPARPHATPSSGPNPSKHARQPLLRRDAEEAAEQVRHDWRDRRWAGIQRDHTPEDVVRLRGSVPIERTLARRGASRLWRDLTETPYVAALGALTGGQAVQMARAGCQAIYASGWQVAADNNLDGETYPDLGLYPSSSMPALVRRVNNALLRADQVECAEGEGPSRDWMLPVVADAEAGFGGPLNAFNLVGHLLEAGAAAVHLEDQLSSAKKCGHMGGKVLVPTLHHVRVLRAARLAADVAGVPSVLIARTDANGAGFVSSDTDVRDQPFLTGWRTREGLYETRPGLESAIQRGLSYAPYADLLWFETKTPDLAEARAFADAIHAQFPGKMLAYNCSPSFNWNRNLDAGAIADFQPALGKLGYRFQFVTLAGFHADSAAVYELARGYAKDGMAAYARLQDHEGGLTASGYTALRHQREAAAGYFDAVGRVIAPGDQSTSSLKDSTEDEQFSPAPMPTAAAAREKAAGPA
jgi:isocitrate lyase